VVDWRRSQIERLPNVAVVTGRHLAAPDVLDYGAAIVVIATGASWRSDGLQPRTHEPIEGAGPAVAHVLTPEQVMLDGKRPAGRRVVVYDTDGYLVAPGVAEQLAGEGYDVHLVTPFAVVSPTSDQTLEGGFLREHLHRKGIRAHRQVILTSVSGAGVEGRDEFGDPFELEADSVVLVTQRTSLDELYLALAGDPAALGGAGIEGLYRIGDAVAPRMTSEAVFDGHRLAMEIDADDPAIALPYDRNETIR
jgi:dimethylamine/trimethylamine dehydrogenase